MCVQSMFSSTSQDSRKWPEFYCFKKRIFPRIIPLKWHRIAVNIFFFVFIQLKLYEWRKSRKEREKTSSFKYKYHKYFIYAFFPHLFTCCIRSPFLFLCRSRGCILSFSLNSMNIFFFTFIEQLYILNLKHRQLWRYSW